MFVRRSATGKWIVLLLTLLWLTPICAEGAKGKKRGKKAKAAEVESAKTASEAAKPAAAPDDETTRIARESYAEGKLAYDAAKYRVALELFKKAYDAKPHPIVLKSVAECKAQLGDLSGAIEIFDEYLNQPGIADRQLIQARVNELKALSVPLVVESEPGGADITLDDEPTGRTTPATFGLAAGIYKVGVNLDGYEHVEEDATLQKGGQAKVTLKLPLKGMPPLPAPVPPAETAPSIEEAPSPALEEEGLNPSPAFWVCAAVTGVGLVSGTVFGTMALNDEEDYSSAPTQAKKDAGERDALISDISFGVAAVASVTGVIILLTGNKKKEQQETAAVAITPFTGPQATGLGAAVSF